MKQHFGVHDFPENYQPDSKMLDGSQNIIQTLKYHSATRIDSDIKMLGGKILVAGCQNVSRTPKCSEGTNIGR